MELTPGGFVVERGVISAEAPMPTSEAAVPDLEAAAPETVEAVVEQTPAETTPLPPDEQGPMGSSVTVNATIAAVGLGPMNPPPSMVDVPIVAADTNVSVPPYILPPAEAYAGQELRMITVILRPGLDKVRDNLRLRQCYGILISYSGHDRFALQIFERSRGYRIEFPNYTTMFCAELVARLGSIVGADNVIVEPLRLH